MAKQSVAFAGSALAPLRAGARLPALDGRRAPQRARVTMADGEGSKKKKVAPVVFATDIKGKPVWKLRSAAKEDTEAAASLVTRLPSEMVGRFVLDSAGNSLVCDGTIKGTKEGEGYKSRIFGVALVDLENEMRDASAGPDAGFVEAAELITVKVHSDMPDADMVKQQLTLGAMKKLKTKGVVRMRASVPRTDQAYIDELKSYGFSGGKTEEDNLILTANLGALNPDPQRKID